MENQKPRHIFASINEETMSTHKSDPVFPMIHPVTNDPYGGLTKREYFAAKAMQGYCGGEYIGQSGLPQEIIAQWCVVMADALIKALNEIPNV